MAICIGVPATTAHNLNNLNNSREGVMQLSFMEEITQTQWRPHSSASFRGMEEPEPGAPSLHRMEAAVVPLSVRNTTEPGDQMPWIHGFVHSRVVWVQVTAADTNSTKNKRVVEAEQHREIFSLTESYMHVTAIYWF